MEDVLAGIDAALEAGLTPLKLNSVLRRSSYRDDVPALLDLAAENYKVITTKQPNWQPGTEYLIRALWQQRKYGEVISTAYKAEGSEFAASARLAARVMLREAPALNLPDGQCVYGEPPVVSLARREGP